MLEFLELSKVVEMRAKKISNFESAHTLTLHRKKMPEMKREQQRETFVEILLEQAKGSAKKYKKKNNRQLDQKCQGCDEAVKDRLYRLLLLLILFVVSKQQQQR